MAVLLTANGCQRRQAGMLVLLTAKGLERLLTQKRLQW
jgi:hypothetical protein